ncbi:MAG: hypothetical protein ACYS26_17340 [Planctomycetota bacterium]|jgi:hypothetical protein
MADEPEEQAPEEEGAGEASSSGGKKKLFLMGGGSLSIVALAFLMAMMAVPKKPEYKTFTGPYLIELQETSIQTNIEDGSGNSFLVFKTSIEYHSFDEAYATDRLADSIFNSRVNDTLLAEVFPRGPDVLQPEMRRALAEHLARSLDPILFPTEVGKAPSVYDADPESGLRTGLSRYDATLRGSLYDHKIEIQGNKKRLRLDEGPWQRYLGDERDLQVHDGRGNRVYLDVSELKEDFSGDVMIGVHGQIHEVLFPEFALQK